MKSISREKLWRSKRPSRKTFHSPHHTFSGFPETCSIAWWRVFWPSMHMRWGLEERIKAPTSWRAPCRQVFILHSKLYFLVGFDFFTIGCSICSALVWTWTRRSWSRRCRPPRPSRTLAPSLSHPLPKYFYATRLTTCHIKYFFLLKKNTRWLSQLKEGQLSTGPTPSSLCNCMRKCQPNLCNPQIGVDICLPLVITKNSSSKSMRSLSYFYLGLVMNLYDYGSWRSFG